MRKIIIIILLVITTLASHAEHFVGIALSPAATWQLDTLVNTRSLPGVAGSIGLVYQYQHQTLLLQTGANIGLTTMRQGVDSMYIGRDTLLRNRIDGMQAFELEIPLMIGAKLRQFYALAGFKAVFSSRATTTQRGTIVIHEGSDRYYDDYNQLFMNVQDISSQGRMGLQPDLRACIEIGAQMKVGRYYLYNRSKPILQIGLFAEYSVLNNQPTGYTKLNTANSADIAIKHVYTPYINHGLKINNLHAGIRVALLFDFTNNDCNCIDY